MIGLAVGIVAVALYLWQDGKHPCLDGDRYTSGKPQPYPFHRRFCGWPKLTLEIASWASLAGLASLMGDWKHALLLVSLPGAWFISTHPTTVDGPSMLLAWTAGLLFPTQPYLAVLLSCLSGFIHERGPVFAALYAWHPLLLVGLVGVGWWRHRLGSDEDKRVGRGLLDSIGAHKKFTDWLDWRTAVYPLRGVILASGYFGASPRAWVTVFLAYASRLVGTDGARFIFWAAPALIHEIPDVPVWFVLAHCMTFRRMV